MPHPIKVIEIELSQPLPTLSSLDGYAAVQALVRLHGVPLGYVKAPIEQGGCSAHTLSRLILDQHHDAIARQLLHNGLAAGLTPQELKIETLLKLSPPDLENWPLVTVAVCSRDRTSDLALCLQAIAQLDYPQLDILVIDNAPTTDATARLVEQHPDIRYVCEPRPGLDWGRNRAILEAKGEIIVYTDDDVIVDRNWVKAIARVFADNPDVMLVTGLVVPHELETEAQILFEQHGGFGRGFAQRWHTGGQQMSWRMLGTGQYGTGANMAYRRSVFAQIGGFDPALDVGTVTNGGGDAEMFFRVLREGHTLVYEPSAIVRHRHRRTHAQLRTQLAHDGAIYSYFVAAGTKYPDQRRSLFWLGLFWMLYWNVRRLLRSLIHPTFFPRDLIWAELWGGFVGLTRYSIARRRAAEIAATFPGQPTLAQPSKHLATETPTQITAVRSIELSQSIAPPANLSDYQFVQLIFTWQHSPIAQVTLPTKPALTPARLQAAIVETIGLRLLDLNQQQSDALLAAKVLTQLADRFLIPVQPTALLPANIPVSIVIGTCDRPDDLRRCLHSLSAQQSSRSIEIIVVDNHPDSGLTAPVVAEFPHVVLLQEARSGVNYARNAGIADSHGEIIVTTDDDVTIPPDWLEKLLVPFARPDVLAVTGNILPIELDTPSQCLFEQYGNGGLGRGFGQFEAESAWFMRSPIQAVPTWELGATANSAYRASIFAHPQIGLMDEALGPGMPSGAGEDIYLFYKILKAGGTIVYEPSACVWHKHRRDRAALSRQLYGYSKGFVSYHLTTLLHDGDLRALLTLFVGLPLYYLKRILLRLLGQSNFPIALMFVEISGNLAAPWSLWQSRQRVQRQGRSQPYVPPAQRCSPVLAAVPSR